MKAWRPAAPAFHALRRLPVTLSSFPCPDSRSLSASFPALCPKLSQGFAPPRPSNFSAAQVGLYVWATYGRVGIELLPQHLSSFGVQAGSTPCFSGTAELRRQFFRPREGEDVRDAHFASRKGSRSLSRSCLASASRYWLNVVRPCTICIFDAFCAQPVECTAHVLLKLLCSFHSPDRLPRACFFLASAPALVLFWRTGWGTPRFSETLERRRQSFRPRDGGDVRDAHLASQKGSRSLSRSGLASASRYWLNVVRPCTICMT